VNISDLDLFLFLNISMDQQVFTLFSLILVCTSLYCCIIACLSYMWFIFGVVKNRLLWFCGACSSQEDVRCCI